MSGSITLTAAMRANLLSLQNTGSNMANVQLQLATGNKVNSALDNPVNYFAAQSLNHRASQLSALLDGMGQAIQTIQAANQGITAITGLVNQLTSIANQATQDLATQTTQNILSTKGASGLASAFVNNLTLAAGSNGKTIASNDTFTLSDGGSNLSSFTILTGESLNTLVNQINETSTFQAKIVYGDGTTTSPNDGVAEAVGSAYLQITAVDGNVVTATDGTTGSGIVCQALGFAAATSATSSAVSTGGAAADQTNYNNVIAQINALAANSNYQGNNLINGTGANMTVQVNELSTNAITVNSVNSTAAAAGLNLAAQLVTSTGGITAAKTAINNALSTLQTQAAGFANALSMIQNRQDFTSNLINTLQSGATSLTIADKNQEGAQMLALQTQQQLGIEALSLSSQANQSVLRLFA